jgi:hypothetical protein
VFNKVISTAEKVDDLGVHLQTLLNEITHAVYTKVSRGLFERHKLVFSFMLCASIYKQAGVINELQWNFLLCGPVSIGMVSHLEAYLLLLSQFFCFMCLFQRFFFHENVVNNKSLFFW